MTMRMDRGWGTGPWSWSSGDSVEPSLRWKLGKCLWRTQAKSQPTEDLSLQSRLPRGPEWAALAEQPSRWGPTSARCRRPRRAELHRPAIREDSGFSAAGPVPLPFSWHSFLAWFSWYQGEKCLFPSCFSQKFPRSNERVFWKTLGFVICC